MLKRGRISGAFFRSRLRLAVGALVMAVGVVLLLLSNMTRNAISISLADAGSLLAGSVALAVVYDIFVKPSQQDETIELAKNELRNPVEAMWPTRVTFSLEQPIMNLISSGGHLRNQTSLRNSSSTSVIVGC
jgi:hypothetical protein